MGVFNAHAEKQRQERLKQLRNEMGDLFDREVEAKVSDIVKIIASRFKLKDVGILRKIRDEITSMCSCGFVDYKYINKDYGSFYNINMDTSREDLSKLPRRKIAVMLVHSRLYGGIRRFFEIGSIMLNRGHDYRIYCMEDNSVKWYDYKGPILPFEEIKDDKFDIVMSGAVKTFPFFDDVNAVMKIIHVIGRKLYRKDYDMYYKRDDITMVGNSSDWLYYFPYMSGYTVSGGVNINFFKPTFSDRSSDKFTILAYGRKNQYKGFEKVIEAVKLLSSSKYKLRLFDDDKDRPRYSGLDVECVVTDSQLKLREVYCSSDVFVSMEEDGGWSNTSIEAMACGIPLICNRVGTSDFAIPYKTAIVIPDSNPSEIADAIELLSNNKDLRYSLAENGINMARSFSWENYCDELEKVFYVGIEGKEKK